MSSQIVPLDIKLRNKSRLMELVYEDISYELSYEFLRVYSPSAEVRGHMPSQSKLQLNKIDVFIENIEFVGSYAIRILFDDGHNTGLYSWEYLNHLGENCEKLWKDYLSDLKKAGHDREQWLRRET